MSAEKYTVETIEWLRRWTPNLFSFRTTRSKAFRFTPGQFARLGVTKNDGTVVWRAYSMVSADYDEFLEFYSIIVPKGEFTTELSQREIGDAVYVEKTNYGFLTLARFEQDSDRPRDLWLLATGTGLAPFLSMLADPRTWELYEHIILVHSVREKPELTYQDTILGFDSNELFGSSGRKLRYVQVVTREPVPGTLGKRLTKLIESEELEAAADCRLNLDRSRIMLCGNPEMLNDTRQVLKERGFTMSRSTKPGQIAVENFW